MAPLNSVRQTLALSPRMRPLNDPALWQSHEPSVDFYNRHADLIGIVQVPVVPFPRRRTASTNMMPVLDVASTRAAIGTVGVKLLEPRGFGTRLRDDRGGGISIPHACSGQCQGNDQIHLIDDEVTLPPLYLLACIETAFAALRRTAVGLAVGEGCGRRIRASHA